jgi:hypothetical protein
MFWPVTMLMRHSPWGCIRNGERYAVCGLGGPRSHGQHGLAAVATAGSGAVSAVGAQSPAGRSPCGSRGAPPSTTKNRCRSALGPRYLGVQAGEQQRRQQCPEFQHEQQQEIVGFAPVASASTHKDACSCRATRRSSSTPAASDWSGACTKMQSIIGM